MRIRSLSMSILTALLLAVPATAQRTRPIPYPVINDAKFAGALERGTRSEDGRPGAAYWMNQADYQIEASLYPGTRILKGSENVTYHNNSPNQITELVVHLRQNLHAEGAVRNRPQLLTGGVRVLSAAINGQIVNERAGRGSDGYSINGTVMTIPLSESLQPGGTVIASFEWEFEVPAAGAPRMGTDGEIFFVAYWYPQIAMYDDVEGWRADQYFGNGEFLYGIWHV